MPTPADHAIVAQVGRGTDPSWCCLDIGHARPIASVLYQDSDRQPLLSVTW
jgi:hypothetical protein